MTEAVREKQLSSGKRSLCGLTRTLPCSAETAAVALTPCTSSVLSVRTGPGTTTQLSPSPVGCGHLAADRGASSPEVGLWYQPVPRWAQRTWGLIIHANEVVNYRAMKLKMKIICRQNHYSHLNISKLEKVTQSSWVDFSYHSNFISSPSPTSAIPWQDLNPHHAFLNRSYSLCSLCLECFSNL